MATISTLTFDLVASSAKLRGDLQKANRSTKKWADKTKRSANSVRRAFAGIGLAFATRGILRAVAKQEKAIRQLEQGLISTGKAAGFETKELVKFAAELQKVTTFGDEDIIGAMSQLATFTNIAGDEFKGTTEAVLNLSARMGTDLKSSVVQLGKALNDPVANLSALSRSGIQFSKDQKAVIKSLVDTGRMAEAQRVILKELERQFGGSAQAARQTFGGALDALGNAFSDLMEGDGNLEDARVSIEELVTTLTDPQVKKGIDTLVSGIVTGFTTALKKISEVTSTIQFLAEEFAAFVNGPAIDDTVRINERLFSLKEILKEVQDQIVIINSNDGITFLPETSLQFFEEKAARIKGQIAELEKLLSLSEPPKPDVIIDINKGIKAPVIEPPELTFLEKWAAKYEKIATAPADAVEKKFISAFDSATTGFSRMTAQAIVEGGDLNEVFDQVAKTLAVDIVAALIQVGVQTAINKAFSTTAKGVEVAESVVAGAAVASAWAPAAAAVSLATLGGNAVPAAAGVSSTFALTSGLALTGIAHEGLDKVPREGTFLLDKGERVIPSDQNERIVRAIEGGDAANNSDINITNVFQISGGDPAAARRELTKLLPSIERMTKESVKSALSRGGSMSRAAGLR